MTASLFINYAVKALSKDIQKDDKIELNDELLIGLDIAVQSGLKLNCTKV